MFIAKIENGGFEYFLRGRVWAGYIDRAQTFETLDQINTAIETIKPYTKPALRKLIQVVEINDLPLWDRKV
jgi:hypothetical protein